MAKITSGIRLEFLRTDTRNFYREYREKSNAIIKKHTETARQLLEDNSPEDLGVFKDSWKIIPPRRQTVTSNTEFKIVNTDEKAFNKFFGRDSGLMPPQAPIENWVRRKITTSDRKEIKRVTFLVRRSIALGGTSRYRDLSVLGIRKDLSYESNSIIDNMEKAITTELNELNLQ